MVRDVDEIVEITIPISIFFLWDHVVVEENIRYVIDGETNH